MHFFEQFYTENLKYKLINKFTYKKTNELAQLKKIVLNYGCNTTDLKTIATSLLALELITKQKGTFTVSKNSNVSLKIRKGNPVGCKITLRKSQMFQFLSKTITNVLPNLKNFEGFSYKRRIKRKAFSYQIHDNFSFSELEKHYYLFNNLSKLDFTLVIDSKKKMEVLFILKELQLPFR